MRRQTPIAHLLYAHLFPHPGPNDPASFSAHLARNLVPEVRIEVATFYGDLTSVESRYPGLNYCNPPHRMRLGRFKHHRRLFEAFDVLGLTENEIQEFCCWEGTKWARERYERDEGVKVVDTTGDEIKPFVDRREVRAALREGEGGRRQSITRKTDISVIVEEASNASGGSQLPVGEEAEENDEDMSDADSEGGEAEEEADNGQETPTVAAARRDLSTELTRRQQQFLSDQHIITAFQQGDTLPPELEQYIKDQSERGMLGVDLRALMESRFRHQMERRSRRGYVALSGPSAGSNTTSAAPRAAA